jgi:hypothetical protein
VLIFSAELSIDANSRVTWYVINQIHFDGAHELIRSQRDQAWRFSLSPPGSQVSGEL